MEVLFGLVCIGLTLAFVVGIIVAIARASGRRRNEHRDQPWRRGGYYGASGSGGAYHHGHSGCGGGSHHDHGSSGCGGGSSSDSGGSGSCGGGSSSCGGGSSSCGGGGSSCGGGSSS
ncbi:hypothetical protein [Nocardia sp. NPDC057668]|uniref:hypothetical protein n=1 Tax=Nocardia sp. NPDC057668 TaxID=3346202 RepID=UPI003672C5FD